MKKGLLFSAALTVLSAAVACADVIGEWDFSKGDVLNGPYKLKVRGNSELSNGALVVPAGNIETGRGVSFEKNYPELSPKNAFSLTIDFQLDSEWDAARQNAPILWDSKYVQRPNGTPDQEKYNAGLQLALEKNAKQENTYRALAILGFGKESLQARSQYFTIAPGKSHSLKFVFTASGKVKFSFDGGKFDVVSVKPGPLAPSVVIPSIGDRVGSNYTAIGGKIFKAKLETEAFNPLSVSSDTMHRRTFERGEDAPAYYTTVYNGNTTSVENLTVTATSGSMDLGKTVIAALAPGEMKSIPVQLDTWLIPGKYPVDITVQDANGKVLCKDSSSFFVAPKYGNFFPVILWGGSDAGVVKDLGFTHQVVSVYPNSGDFTSGMVPDALAGMDNNLENGLYSFGSASRKYRFETTKRYLRIAKDGKPYARIDVEASNPLVRKEFADVAEMAASMVGDHPGWDMLLSNSEVRDSSEVSFGGGEPARFKEYSGFDIPPYVTGKYARAYETVPGAPWDRIVKDDADDLVFYRWFWREGDGWNDVHTAIDAALHKHIKHHFMTFYDPAVRVPPLWGSGGNVDVLSQWTYTYPDPIKIGQATDEIVAMAQGRPGQKVMSMTQAIWYRSGTAPIDKKVDNPPEWIEREPEAAYITIAPDFLREAIWSKISRRIDGIMYHGSGSLISVEQHSYRYTNPESKNVLREMSRRVLEPVGQMVPLIPERKPEVAILESFTSCIYNPYEFPFGWSRGWITDLHLALQWVGIQPAILYEEHLLNDLNTENLKVLFVPMCDILTEGVLLKIQELQEKGVLIIGDELANQALMLDARIQSLPRKTNDPEGSKKRLQNLGLEIAEIMAPYYKTGVSTSNQDIVVRRRGTDDADYVFVLNDKRTFGDYVGQWGLVMEKGLPNAGEVGVKFPAAVAYDLIEHKKVDLKYVNGKAVFSTELAPGDGSLVMLLKNPIAKITAEVSEKASLKGKYEINAKWLGPDGAPVKAYIPVQVTIRDAAGNTLPGSGYYVAENGMLLIDEIMATNASKGKAAVEIKCLASGTVKNAEIEIE